MNAWEERWNGLSDDAKFAIAASFKRQADELRELLDVALSGVCHRITPEELNAILGGGVNERARLLLENRLLSQSRNDAVAINERLCEENERLQKQYDDSIRERDEDRRRDYGYSQKTVDAIVKERDRLRQLCLASLHLLRGAEAIYDPRGDVGPTHWLGTCDSLIAELQKEFPECDDSTGGD